MSRGGAASARKIGLAERRDLAWELRKRGYDFRGIAAELGYSKSSAERDVKHVLGLLIDRTVESAAEARALDLARLDDLLRSWYWPATGIAAPETEAEKDEDEAADEAATNEAAERLRETLENLLDKDAAAVVLKILEQRAKLLGLYRQEVALTTPAPLRVDAGIDLSGLDEESLDAIIGNLTAALGAGGD